MNRKLKQLTWKYFKEQKAKELLSVLQATLIVLSILGVLFGVIGICWLLKKSKPQTLGGIAVILAIIFTILWLRSSWRKAEARARRRLR